MAVLVKICDARIVWACEKKMVELAKQLEDANEASIRVKTLLDLALAGVDEQKKKVEELLKRAEEKYKRLEDLW